MAKIVFNYEFDNKQLREFAAEWGHPCPGDGQCDALRREARDKIEAAMKKGMTNFGCACDGRSCFIHPTNVDSLAFIFGRKHETDTCNPTVDGAVA